MQVQAELVEALVGLLVALTAALTAWQEHRQRQLQKRVLDAQRAAHADKRRGDPSPPAPRADGNDDGNSDIR